MEKIADDFWAHVDARDPKACWEWKRARDSGGYGMLWENGSNIKAHRKSYELSNGPIPSGMYVCHRCDNPPCCNPDHLFLGTAADNIRDCSEKGRTAGGDQHGSRLHPERVARGDRHGSRTCPERRARGVLHGRAKLTNNKVKKIRAMYEEGIHQAEIAKKFGIDRATVRDIVRQKTWKHVV